MKLVAACASIAALSLSACVYPRRSTPVLEVDQTRVPGAPDDVYSVRFASAVIPPRQRGDLAWDDDEGLPDAYAKLYVRGRLLFESRPVEDSLQPNLDATVPFDVEVAPGDELRIELWDKDRLSDTPIGIMRSRGWPSSMVLGGEMRILLDSDALVTVVVDRPRAKRGAGLAEYEDHGDTLVAIRVLPHSPAGRAGLVAGDRIVAIDGKSIEVLGTEESARALVRAGYRRTRLTVEREGRQETLELDGGYTWVSR